MHQWSASGSGTGESLECFGRNQCYPVRTGKGIWWYWAASGSGTGKSVSITMVATVPSIMLKPANVTHLWIEEDLIYTSVHKAFRFDQSYSCSKGVFGRRQSNGSQYSELHHTEFLNVKWRRHMLLPTFKQLLLETY